MPLLVRKRVIGQQAMISHVTLEPGLVVPTHHHENEQFVCMLSGKARFVIGEEVPPIAPKSSSLAGKCYNYHPTCGTPARCSSAPSYSTSSALRAKPPASITAIVDARPRGAMAFLGKL